MVLGFIGIADTIIVRVFVQNMDLGVLLPSVIGVFFIILYLRPLWDKYYIKLNNVIKRIIYWGFLVFLIIFIIVEGCIILGGVYKPRPEQQPEYVVVLGRDLGNGMPTLSLAIVWNAARYAAEP